MSRSQQPKSSPQVLFLTDIFAPVIGGAAAVAEAIAANQPANILVAASTPRGRAHGWSPASDQQFPFRTIRVPFFAANLSRAIPGKLRGLLQTAADLLFVRPICACLLLWKLRGVPLDVVCVSTLLPCYWVPQWLKLVRPRLRVVFYLHGEEVNDSPRRRRTDRLAQEQLRRADAVVTVSTFTAGRAMRVGVAAEKITPIFNGVDLRRFSPGPRDLGLLGTWGLSDQPLLLCLARLDERKGQDNLIRAMPAILRTLPDARLLLAGDGDDRQRLQHIASTSGVAQSIIFAGRIPDEQIVPLYRSADVYVMPNRTTVHGDTEGFGLVFLEAGACERAVIGGNAGGVPDAVVDGETGLLVDGTDVQGIADACLRLLLDSDLRAAMARRGLTRSHELSWANQSARFLALCEALLPADATHASTP